MLITISKFIFSKFLSVIFFFLGGGGRIWFENVKFSKLTETGGRVHCDMLITILVLIIIDSNTIIIERSSFTKFSCLRYYGQILSHLVFSKLTEVHPMSVLILSKYGEQQILGGKLSQII